MPQLMPLMWVNSIIITMLIFVVLLEMFFYKSYDLMMVKVSSEMEEMMFKW